MLLYGLGNDEKVTTNKSGEQRRYIYFRLRCLIQKDGREVAVSVIKDSLKLLGFQYFAKAKSLKQFSRRNSLYPRRDFPACLVLIR
jgi:hypothetical protein